MVSVSEQVENPFRYASYRYDTETGLYYLQNRYYNPDLMRFITRDAIRDTVGEPSQSNYYHYADGNPIMNVDPDGLAAYRTITSYVDSWREPWRLHKWWDYVTYALQYRILKNPKGSKKQQRVMKIVKRTNVYVSKRYARYKWVTYRSDDFGSSWYYWSSGYRSVYKFTDYWWQIGSWWIPQTHWNFL